MGFLDIILGGFLAYGLIKGIWKGLFVELASLVALILGIYIAIKFSSLIGAVMVKWIEWNSKYIEITAFALTFILVVIGIVLLGKLFTKIAEFASLGWLNRIAGGFFGTLKILLILSIILHYFQKLNYNDILIKDETINKSIFFNPILVVFTTVFPVIEEWLPKDY